MNNLQIVARYQIHSDKLAEFKKLVEECHAIVLAKDKETLQYDWYFNESQTECVLIETFPDLKAFLTHVENIGELVGKFSTMADMSAEIFGQPSEELLKAVSGLNVKIYTFFQGK